MKKILLTALVLAGFTATAQVKVGSNPTTLATDANFQVEATDGTQFFINKPNGNVGIGTTTPTSKLHVTDTADPLKLEGLQTGSATDTYLVVNASGVVKKENTASCNTSKVNTIVSPIHSSTGKVWMDRNLGACRKAQSVDDFMAYGQLYQWGRGNDGHAGINWTSATAGTPVNGTTTTLSTTDYPDNNLFILQPASPYDWRATQNDNLWQGVAGINNPCPAGYRLPTLAELNAEVTQYSITNRASAFASPLKFTVPGLRHPSDGSLYDVGSYGYYWSSSVSGTNARNLHFYSSAANTNNNNRANGFSVRCLKD